MPRYIVPIFVFGLLGMSCNALGFWNFLPCLYGECCSDKWINREAPELYDSLEKRVYGQHLAIKVVSRHIKAHLADSNPPKALSLSFHGGTGTGKNHVSKIIAEHLYKEGIKSTFVHFLLSTVEFPHAQDVSIYKDNLRNLLEKSVESCDRSLFIFDEVDQLPPGLIDIIRPYLEFHDSVKGINYRKAIFLFLSNTARNEIFDYTVKSFHGGMEREKIELKDMEKLVITAAANKDSKVSGGFYKSELILRHTLTAYIPFLPLERRHVRQCIRHYLLEKKYYGTERDINESKVDEIIDQIQHFPENEQLFSVTGCRRVKDKVDLVMRS